MFGVQDTFPKVARLSRLRVGVFFDKRFLSRDTSDLSRETLVALQFFCSLLCDIALSENEAERFYSTKIKTSTYFFQNFFRHRPTAN